MNQANILIVGSYLAGLTMRMTRFPLPGETLIGRDFTQFHGGKGSNQAVACARLGAKTGFATCVGRDGLGEGALSLYAREGVDASRTEVLDGVSTGVGIILVNEEGENEIVLDLGACNRLTPAFVDALSDQIRAADMVLCQLEIPVEAVLRTAEIARVHGVPFLLNPAPWQELPAPLYPLISVITPNETEAHAMLDLAPDAPATPEDMVEKIQRLGVSRVALTMGEQGVCFADQKGSIGRMPAKRATVIDTTGAGDTFSAALAVALCEGRDFTDAITFAQKAASFTIGQYGVIEALPHRAEVDAG